MSQCAPTRITAFIVSLALLFGSVNTAWAAPTKPLHRDTTSVATQRVSHPAAVPTTSSLAVTDDLGFSATERTALQQRQAQAQHLQQFQGGEVIVIGSTALLIILAVVLVVVLVD